MAQYLSPRVAELSVGTASPRKLFPVLLEELQGAHPPTVLIFEDVHWADHGTLDLIKYVGRRIGMLPALVILSFRKDEVDDRHPLSEVIGDLLAQLPRHRAISSVGLVPAKNAAHCVCFIRSIANEAVVMRSPFRISARIHEVLFLREGVSVGQNAAQSHAAIFASGFLTPP